MSRVIVLMLVLGALSTPAQAYFDPGSGAVMLQVLIAAGIGAVYRFRAWFAALIRILSSLFRR